VKALSGKEDEIGDPKFELCEGAGVEDVGRIVCG
jgi:hypothetical protein